MKIIAYALATLLVAGCAGTPTVEEIEEPAEEIAEVSSYFDECKYRHEVEGIPIHLAGQLAPDMPVVDCLFYGSLTKAVCKNKEKAIEWSQMFIKMHEEGVEDPSLDPDVSLLRAQARCKMAQGLLAREEGAEEIAVFNVNIQGREYINHLWIIPGQIFGETPPKTYWTTYGVFFEVTPAF